MAQRGDDARVPGDGAVQAVEDEPVLHPAGDKAGREQQHAGEGGAGELAALVGVEDLRRAVAHERLLQRLEAEGYVTIRPKQGCFVRDIDIDVINQFYDVRIALEMLWVKIPKLNFIRVARTLGVLFRSRAECGLLFHAEGVRDQVFATKDFKGILGTTWSLDANGDTTVVTMSKNQVKDGKFTYLGVAQ